jgi:DNA-directed RNA polymerase specialized sigma24 family protein
MPSPDAMQGGWPGDTMSEDARVGLRRSMEQAGLTEVRTLATIPLAGSPMPDAPRPALTAVMRSALGSLPPRQRMAVELYHGLRDGRAWSFPEIGRRLGISAEHARRMVENGRQRLRWLTQG